MPGHWRTSRRRSQGCPETSSGYSGPGTKDSTRMPGTSRSPMMRRAAGSTSLPTRQLPTTRRAGPASCESFRQPFVLGCYRALPASVQGVADRSCEVLSSDPEHPSLQLEKLGRYWSVRVGLRYRALAVEVDRTLVLAALRASGFAPLPRGLVEDPRPLAGRGLFRGGACGNAWRGP